MSKVSLDNEDKKFIVEKYLDQVKILTALASALFITPSLLQFIVKITTNKSLDTSTVKLWFLLSNISFLIVVILTYFIYSSVVCFMKKGEFDIERPLTRCFSIVQFGILVIGCIFFIIFVRNLI